MSAASASIGGALARGQRIRLHLLAVVDNDDAERPGRIPERSQVDGSELTLYITHRLSPWRPRPAGVRVRSLAR